MAIERAPELERLVEQISEAWRRGDAETVESMLSEDPAVLVVGTDPGEIWDGREQAIEGIRTEIPTMAENAGLESIQDERRGYRAGDIGWVFVQGKYRLPDGSEIPSRGIWIFQREDGEWKSLQSFYSIAVPNSTLEAGSPIAQALSGATR